MIFRIKLLLARFVGTLARTLGKGGGTTVPGGVLLTLDSKAIAKLAGQLTSGSSVISATNGKTTTAAMFANIVRDSGTEPVHNAAGANLASGVASTLLTNTGFTGKARAKFGIFEVDEFWLQRVVPQLQPRALLLANLFRDQLDRYGELETIGERWSELVAALAADQTVVLNADDPLVADLGFKHQNCLYFGVEDSGVARTDLQHASDSKHCRNCGMPYSYSAVFLGHLGHYSCSNCGAKRPLPDVVASDIQLHGTDYAEFKLQIRSQPSQLVRLQLPGLYNVYNALGAAALATAMGFKQESIVAGLEATSAAFGRAQRLQLGTTELLMLLIKNPVGANEVIRTLMLQDGEITLLAVLNDQIADGRDVSWIWDADFELLSDRVKTVVCSGSRAAELAVRLKYAGVPPARIKLVAEPEKALDRALEAAAGERLFVLPTYTAMLRLQAILRERGMTDAYWERKDS